MKSIFKILGNPIVKWSAVGAIGLIAFSIAGVNLVADKQEKPIEADLEAFAKEFPKTDYNNTAIALKSLSAKLGFDVYSWSKEANSEFDREIAEVSIEPNAQKSWEAIDTKLTEYLDTQLAKPSSEIDAPPPELQNYLKANAKTIAQIKDVILKQGSPVWRTSLTPIIEGNIAFLR
jgi:hypothetical protein